MRSGSLARKAIKLATLPVGLGTFRRRGDVTILLYHRVGSEDSELAMPPMAFDRHLRWLVGNERLLTLEEALSGKEGGVVVTLDDGYRDFHEVVVPMLVLHRVPAVLYVATGLIEDGSSLASASNLTWSQLEEAVSTGLVTIGAHTHTHADLSRLDETAADEEMRRCQDLVEDRLGVPCRHFAYPWAVGSPAADRAARRLFDSAALDAWKTNRRGRLDPYRLGRTPILRSDGEAFFRLKVRGLLDGEALAYRFARRGPWGRG